MCFAIGSQHHNQNTSQIQHMQKYTPHLIYMILPFRPQNPRVLLERVRVIGGLGIGGRGIGGRGIGGRGIGGRGIGAVVLVAVVSVAVVLVAVVSVGVRR